MTIIKVKNCLILFLSLLLLQSCNNASNSYNENAGNELSKYELVKDWPQLSPGFLLSPVSGVGVDNQQNIFSALVGG